MKGVGINDDPALERGIAWDDPDVGIEWPIRDPQVSQKDANAGSFQDYLKNPAFAYRSEAG